ncbi:MFS transporter [Eupransor demetentiae]|uniref:MFS family (AraJ) n=1 Tax=Eupransor demetentiae TaxID=3109584 RepID=A0ABM9N490_9LACO|nr:MFS family (AraJ) [Lactobacillaceae bacterium LMG 33000]
MTQDKQANTNSKTFLTAILSVSVMITTGQAVSSAVPEMAKSFPDVPASLMNSVVTIQQLTVVITLLLSGWISKKIGIKKTIAIGLITVGIAGVIPALVHSFPIIFISRLFLGAGIGLFNSLAITIIDLFYKGAEQSKILGYRTATEQLGTSALTLLVGALVLINWEASFLIYLLAFPFLAFFWKFVPEPPVDKHASAQKQKINLPVLGMAALLMVMVMCSTSVVVQTPNIVVTDLGLNGTVASLIVTLNTFVGTMTGFVFGKIYAELKNFVVPTGMAFMSLGSLVIVAFPNIFTVALGAAICGVAYPLVGSYLFSNVDNVAPEGSQNLANSAMLVGANLGATIAPSVLTMFSNLNNAHTQSAPFFTLFLMLAAFAAIALAYLLGLQGANTAKTYTTKYRRARRNNNINK